MTVRYVVEVLCVGGSSYAMVFRSRDSAVNHGKKIFNNWDVYRVNVCKCKDFKYFTNIKIYK
jgi:hypothetical protein